MIVAVSARVMQEPHYAETRDALSHDWTTLLFRFGVTPVIVPNTVPDAHLYLHAIGAQRLLLTGGDDLSPIANDANKLAASMRDKTEFALLKAAIDTNMPVFAVCRGLQLINVYFGGELTHNLADEISEDHTACSHKVVLCGSHKELFVNSYHAHGVLQHQVPPVLEITALSELGVVEGLSHCEYSISAIMWHPEREHPINSFSTDIITQWLT